MVAMPNIDEIANQIWIFAQMAKGGTLKEPIVPLIASEIYKVLRQSKEHWVEYEKGCGDPDCDLTKDLLVNGIQKSRIYQSKKYREGFNSAKQRAIDIVMTSEDPEDSLEDLKAMKPIEQMTPESLAGEGK